MTSKTPSAAATLRIRLADIDIKMAKLRTRLAQLAASRNSIVDAIQSHLSPILTLPPEITAEIFTEYAGTKALEDTSTDSHHISSMRIAVTLASVCSAWREVALDLQKLWCTLQVSPGDEESTLRWLSRAPDVPLHLHFLMRKPHAPAAGIFAVLAPHSERWQTFQYTGPDDALIFPNDSSPWHLPLLTELHLFAFILNAPKVITAFSEAPQLRKLVLNFLPPHSVLLPWHQLTTLECLLQKPVRCLEILRLTPRLEMLTLSVAEFTSMQQPMVKLAHLHTLLFKKTTFDNMYLDMASFLILPSLTRFETEDFHPASSMDITELVERSKCSLRSISFPAPASAYDVVSTVHQIRSLHHIHIADCTSWRPLAHAAFYDRMVKDTFLPNLQTLRIIGPCNLEIPYKALARMLAVRSKGSTVDGVVTARLEAFELSLRLPAAVLEGTNCRESQMNPGINKLMESAVDAGCQISVPGFPILPSVVRIRILLSSVDFMLKLYRQAKSPSTASPLEPFDDVFC
ncbi:hypothetical protein C8R46DRAFT_1331245 [Mycena filopes]|nr:hypothetical protein C8R46DRAFT_1331245 [Mycena filopes]